MSISTSNTAATRATLKGIAEIKEQERIAEGIDSVKLFSKMVKKAEEAAQAAQ